MEESGKVNLEEKKTVFKPEKRPTEINNYFCKGVLAKRQHKITKLKCQIHTDLK